MILYLKIMILYPHLLKHNHVTLFWKVLLERISIGDAPFGTQILDHSLLFTGKKRELHHEISLKTSTVPQVIDFFESIVGLQLQYVYYNSWKEIKRKVIKDNLIQEYVARFQEEYKLNYNQTNYLSSMIHLYITLKRITPQDILLETIQSKHGYPCTRIRSITGIYYSAPDDRIKFKPEHQNSDMEEEEDEEVDSEEDVLDVTEDTEAILEEDDNNE